jgi:hypothetical protein
MNSDGDEIYTKIVAFDDIYNFVVQTVLIWIHLWTQKSIYGSDLSLRYPDLDSISIF